MRRYGSLIKINPSDLYLRSFEPFLTCLSNLVNHQAQLCSLIQVLGVYNAYHNLHIPRTYKLSRVMKMVCVRTSVQKTGTAPFALLVSCLI